MYIITFEITDVPGKLKYLGIDLASGGYPYWSDSLTQAKFFPTMEKLNEELNSGEFTRNSTYSDHMSPPGMIYSGLGLCNDRTFGRGIVSVKRIALEDVSSFAVAGSHNKPMLFGKKIDKDTAKKLIKFNSSLTVYSDSQKYFIVDEASVEMNKQNPGFQAIKYFFPMAVAAGKIIDDLEGLIEFQYSKETYCGE